MLRTKMRQRFVSALLAAAMMLSLLPATGLPAPTVETAHAVGAFGHQCVPGEQCAALGSPDPINWNFSDDKLYFYGLKTAPDSVDIAAGAWAYGSYDRTGESVLIVRVDTEGTAHVWPKTRGGGNGSRFYALDATSKTKLRNTLKNGSHKLILHEGITAIGVRAFEGFTELQEIEIPYSVEYIGERAFAGCTGLKKVTFLDEYEGKSQSKLKILGSKNGVNGGGATTGGVFSNTQITDFTIPASVKDIATGLFSSGNMGQLKQVRFPNNYGTQNADVTNVLNKIADTAKVRTDFKTVNFNLPNSVQCSNLIMNDPTVTFNEMNGDITITYTLRAFQQVGQSYTPKLVAYYGMEVAAGAPIRITEENEHNTFTFTVTQEQLKKFNKGTKVYSFRLDRQNITTKYSYAINISKVWFNPTGSVLRHVCDDTCKAAPGYNNPPGFCPIKVDEASKSTVRFTGSDHNTQWRDLETRGNTIQYVPSGKPFSYRLYELVDRSQAKVFVDWGLRQYKFADGKGSYPGIDEKGLKAGTDKSLQSVPWAGEDVTLEFYANWRTNTELDRIVYTNGSYDDGKGGHEKHTAFGYEPDVDGQGTAKDWGDKNSGTDRFRAASLTVPNAADPTTPTTANNAYDSSKDNLQVKLFTRSTDAKVKVEWADGSGKDYNNKSLTITPTTQMASTKANYTKNGQTVSKPCVTVTVPVPRMTTNTIKITVTDKNDNYPSVYFYTFARNGYEGGAETWTNGVDKAGVFRVNNNGALGDEIPAVENVVSGEAKNNTLTYYYTIPSDVTKIAVAGRTKDVKINNKSQTQVSVAKQDILDFNAIAVGSDMANSVKGKPNWSTNSSSFVFGAQVFDYSGAAAQEGKLSVFRIGVLPASVANDDTENILSQVYAKVYRQKNNANVKKITLHVPNQAAVTLYENGAMKTPVPEVPYFIDTVTSATEYAKLTDENARKKTCYITVTPEDAPVKGEREYTYNNANHPGQTGATVSGPGNAKTQNLKINTENTVRMNVQPEDTSKQVVGYDVKIKRKAAPELITKAEINGTTVPGTNYKYSHSVPYNTTSVTVKFTLGDPTWYTMEGARRNDDGTYSATITLRTDGQPTTTQTFTAKNPVTNITQQVTVEVTKLRNPAEEKDGDITIAVTSKSTINPAAIAGVTGQTGVYNVTNAGNLNSIVFNKTNGDKVKITSVLDTDGDEIATIKTKNDGVINANDLPQGTNQIRVKVEGKQSYYTINFTPVSIGGVPVSQNIELEYTAINTNPGTGEVTITVRPKQDLLVGKKYLVHLYAPNDGVQMNPVSEVVPVEEGNLTPEFTLTAHQSNFRNRGTGTYTLRLFLKTAGGDEQKKSSIDLKVIKTNFIVENPAQVTEIDQSIGLNEVSKATVRFADNKATKTYWRDLEEKNKTTIQYVVDNDMNNFKYTMYELVDRSQEKVLKGWKQDSTGKVTAGDGVTEVKPTAAANATETTFRTVWNTNTELDRIAYDNARSDNENGQALPNKHIPFGYDPVGGKGTTATDYVSNWWGKKAANEDRFNAASLTDKTVQLEDDSARGNTYDAAKDKLTLKLFLRSSNVKVKVEWDGEATYFDGTQRQEFTQQVIAENLPIQADGSYKNLYGVTVAGRPYAVVAVPVPRNTANTIKITITPKTSETNADGTPVESVYYHTFTRAGISDNHEVWPDGINAMGVFSTGVNNEQSGFLSRDLATGTADEDDLTYYYTIPSTMKTITLAGTSKNSTSTISVDLAPANVNTFVDHNGLTGDALRGLADVSGIVVSSASILHDDQFGIKPHKVSDYPNGTLPEGNLIKKSDNTPQRFSKNAKNEWEADDNGTHYLTISSALTASRYTYAENSTSAQPGKLSLFKFTITYPVDTETGEAPDPSAGYIKVYRQKNDATIKSIKLYSTPEDFTADTNGIDVCGNTSTAAITSQAQIPYNVDTLVTSVEAYNALTSDKKKSARILKIVAHDPPVAAADYSHENENHPGKTGAKVIVDERIDLEENTPQVQMSIKPEDKDVNATNYTINFTRQPMPKLLKAVTVTKVMPDNADDSIPATPDAAGTTYIATVPPNATSATLEFELGAPDYTMKRESGTARIWTYPVDLPIGQDEITIKNFQVARLVYPLAQTYTVKLKRDYQDTEQEVVLPNSGGIKIVVGDTKTDMDPPATIKKTEDYKYTVKHDPAGGTNKPTLQVTQGNNETKPKVSATLKDGTPLTVNEDGYVDLSKVPDGTDTVKLEIGGKTYTVTFEPPISNANYPIAPVTIERVTFGDNKFYINLKVSRYYHNLDKYRLKVTVPENGNVDGNVVYLKKTAADTTASIETDATTIGAPITPSTTTLIFDVTDDAITTKGGTYKFDIVPDNGVVVEEDTELSSVTKNLSNVTFDLLGNLGVHGGTEDKVTITPNDPIYQNQYNLSDSNITQYTLPTLTWEGNDYVLKGWNATSPTADVTKDLLTAGLVRPVSSALGEVTYTAVWETNTKLAEISYYHPTEKKTKTFASTDLAAQVVNDTFEKGDILNKTLTLNVTTQSKKVELSATVTAQGVTRDAQIPDNRIGTDNTAQIVLSDLADGQNVITITVTEKPALGESPQTTIYTYNCTIVPEGADVNLVTAVEVVNKNNLETYKTEPSDAKGGVPVWTTVIPSSAKETYVIGRSPSKERNMKIRMSASGTKPSVADVGDTETTVEGLDLNTMYAEGASLVTWKDGTGTLLTVNLYLPRKDNTSEGANEVKGIAQIYRQSDNTNIKQVTSRVGDEKPKTIEFNNDAYTIVVPDTVDCVTSPTPTPTATVDDAKKKTTAVVSVIPEYNPKDDPQFDEKNPFKQVAAHVKSDLKSVDLKEPGETTEFTLDIYAEDEKVQKTYTFKVRRQKANSDKLQNLPSEGSIEVKDKNEPAPYPPARIEKVKDKEKEYDVTYTPDNGNLPIITVKDREGNEKYKIDGYQKYKFENGVWTQDGDPLEPGTKYTYVYDNGQYQINFIPPLGDSDYKIHLPGPGGGTIETTPENNGLPKLKKDEKGKDEDREIIVEHDPHEDSKDQKPKVVINGYKKAYIVSARDDSQPEPKDLSLVYLTTEQRTITSDKADEDYGRIPVELLPSGTAEITISVTKEDNTTEYIIVKFRPPLRHSEDPADDHKTVMDEENNVTIGVSYLGGNKKYGLPEIRKDLTKGYVVKHGINDGDVTIITVKVNDAPPAKQISVLDSNENDITDTVVMTGENGVIDTSRLPRGTEKIIIVLDDGKQYPIYFEPKIGDADPNKDVLLEDISVKTDKATGDITLATKTLAYQLTGRTYTMKLVGPNGEEIAVTPVTGEAIGINSYNHAITDDESRKYSFGVTQKTLKDHGKGMYTVEFYINHANGTQQLVGTKPVKIIKVTFDLGTFGDKAVTRHTYDNSDKTLDPIDINDVTEATVRIMKQNGETPPANDPTHYDMYWRDLENTNHNEIQYVVDGKFDYTMYELLDRSQKYVLAGWRQNEDSTSLIPAGKERQAVEGTKDPYETTFTAIWVTNTALDRIAYDNARSEKLDDLRIPTKQIPFGYDPYGKGYAEDRVTGISNYWGVKEANEDRFDAKALNNNTPRPDNDQTNDYKPAYDDLVLMLFLRSENVKVTVDWSDELSGYEYGKKDERHRLEIKDKDNNPVKVNGELKELIPDPDDLGRFENEFGVPYENRPYVTVKVPVPRYTLNTIKITVTDGEGNSNTYYQTFTRQGYIKLDKGEPVEAWPDGVNSMAVFANGGFLARDSVTGVYNNAMVYYYALPSDIKEFVVAATAQNSQSEIIMTPSKDVKYDVKNGIEGVANIVVSTATLLKDEQFGMRFVKKTELEAKDKEKVFTEDGTPVMFKQKVTEAAAGQTEAGQTEASKAIRFELADDGEYVVLKSKALTAAEFTVQDDQNVLNNYDIAYFEYRVKPEKPKKDSEGEPEAMEADQNDPKPEQEYLGYTKVYRQKNNPLVRSIKVYRDQEELDAQTPHLVLYEHGNMENYAYQQLCVYLTAAVAEKGITLTNDDVKAFIEQNPLMAADIASAPESRFSLEVPTKIDAVASASVYKELSKEKKEVTWIVSIEPMDRGHGDDTNYTLKNSNHPGKTGAKISVAHANEEGILKLEGDNPSVQMSIQPEDRNQPNYNYTADIKRLAEDDLITSINVTPIKDGTEVEQKGNAYTALVPDTAKTVTVKLNLASKYDKYTVDITKTTSSRAVPVDGKDMEYTVAMSRNEVVVTFTAKNTSNHSTAGVYTLTLKRDDGETKVTLPDGGTVEVERDPPNAKTPSLDGKNKEDNIVIVEHDDDDLADEGKPIVKITGYKEAYIINAWTENRENKLALKGNKIEVPVVGEDKIGTIPVKDLPDGTAEIEIEVTKDGDTHSIFIKFDPPLTNSKVDGTGNKEEELVNGAKIYVEPKSGALPSIENLGDTNRDGKDEYIVKHDRKKNTAKKRELKLYVDPGTGGIAAVTDPTEGMDKNPIQIGPKDGTTLEQHQIDLNNLPHGTDEIEVSLTYKNNPTKNETVTIKFKPAISNPDDNQWVEIPDNNEGTITVGGLEDPYTIITEEPEEDPNKFTVITRPDAPVPTIVIESGVEGDKPRVKEPDGAKIDDETGEITGINEDTKEIVVVVKDEKTGEEKPITILLKSEDGNKTVNLPNDEEIEGTITVGPEIGRLPSIEKGDEDNEVIVKRDPKDEDPTHPTVKIDGYTLAVITAARDKDGIPLSLKYLSKDELTIIPGNGMIPVEKLPNGTAEITIHVKTKDGNEKDIIVKFDPPLSNTNNSGVNKEEELPGGGKVTVEPTDPSTLPSVEKGDDDKEVIIKHDPENEEPNEPIVKIEGYKSAVITEARDERSNELSLKHLSKDKLTIIPEPGNGTIPVDILPNGTAEITIHVVMEDGTEDDIIVKFQPPLSNEGDEDKRVTVSETDGKTITIEVSGAGDPKIYPKDKDDPTKGYDITQEEGANPIITVRENGDPAEDVKVYRDGEEITSDVIESKGVIDTSRLPIGTEDIIIVVDGKEYPIHFTPAVGGEELVELKDLTVETDGDGNFTITTAPVEALQIGKTYTLKLLSPKGSHVANAIDSQTIQAGKLTPEFTLKVSQADLAKRENGKGTYFVQLWRQDGKDTETLKASKSMDVFEVNLDVRWSEDFENWVKNEGEFEDYDDTWEGVTLLEIDERTTATIRRMKQYATEHGGTESVYYQTDTLKKILVQKYYIGNKSQIELPELLDVTQAMVLKGWSTSATGSGNIPKNTAVTVNRNDAKNYVVTYYPIWQANTILDRITYYNARNKDENNQPLLKQIPFGNDPDTLQYWGDKTANEDRLGADSIAEPAVAESADPDTIVLHVWTRSDKVDVTASVKGTVGKIVSISDMALKGYSQQDYQTGGVVDVNTVTNPVNQRHCVDVAVEVPQRQITTIEITVTDKENPSRTTVYEHTFVRAYYDANDKEAWPSGLNSMAAFKDGGFMARVDTGGTRGSESNVINEAITYYYTVPASTTEIVVAGTALDSKDTIKIESYTGGATLNGNKADAAEEFAKIVVASSTILNDSKFGLGFTEDPSGDWMKKGDRWVKIGSNDNPATKYRLEISSAMDIRIATLGPNSEYPYGGDEFVFKYTVNADTAEEAANLMEALLGALEGIDLTATDGLTITAEPSDTDGLTITAEPTGTDEPSNTDEPTGTDEPSSTDEPTGTDEPSNTDEPNGTDEPSGTDEPNGTDEPSGTDEPNGTDEPSGTDEPNGTDEPSDTDEPDDADEPKNDDESEENPEEEDATLLEDVKKTYIGYLVVYRQKNDPLLKRITVKKNGNDASTEQELYTHERLLKRLETENIEHSTKSHAQLAALAERITAKTPVEVTVPWYVDEVASPTYWDELNNHSNLTETQKRRYSVVTIEKFDEGDGGIPKRGHTGATVNVLGTEREPGHYKLTLDANNQCLVEIQVTPEDGSKTYTYLARVTRASRPSNVIVLDEEKGPTLTVGTEKDNGEIKATEDEKKPGDYTVTVPLKYELDPEDGIFKPTTQFPEVIDIDGNHGDVTVNGQPYDEIIDNKINISGVEPNDNGEIVVTIVDNDGKKHTITIKGEDNTMEVPLIGDDGTTLLAKIAVLGEGDTNPTIAKSSREGIQYTLSYYLDGAYKPKIIVKPEDGYQVNTVKWTRPPVYDGEAEYKRSGEILDWRLSHVVPKNATIEIAIKSTDASKDVKPTIYKIEMKHTRPDDGAHKVWLTVGSTIKCNDAIAVDDNSGAILFANAIVYRVNNEKGKNPVITVSPYGESAVDVVKVLDADGKPLTDKPEAKISSDKKNWTVTNLPIGTNSLVLNVPSGKDKDEVINDEVTILFANTVEKTTVIELPNDDGKIKVGEDDPKKDPTDPTIKPGHKEKEYIVEYDQTKEPHRPAVKVPSKAEVIQVIPQGDHKLIKVTPIEGTEYGEIDMTNVPDGTTALVIRVTKGTEYHDYTIYFNPPIGSTGDTNTPGGGGGGGGGTPTKPLGPVVEIEGKPDGEGGLNADKGDSKQPVKDLVDYVSGNDTDDKKTDNVTIIVKPPKDHTDTVNNTGITLDKDSVGDLGNKTDANLTISTPNGNVTIGNDALSELGKGNGDVTVSLDKNTDGTIKVEISKGGKDVEKIPNGISLEIPAENLRPGHVVIVLDEGEKLIRKSHVVDGVMKVHLSGNATFKIEDLSKSFVDVPATHWARDSVDSVSARELFRGIDDFTFAPDMTMSRSMMVTVLHRLEDLPSGGTHKFTDVERGSWYADAVAWGGSNTVVKGTSETTFSPSDDVTREQIAAFLYRHANLTKHSTNEKGDLSKFTDGNTTSDWALDAMRWAVGVGILQGDDHGAMRPTANATRAEVATMMMRYCQLLAKTGIVVRK